MAGETERHHDLRMGVYHQLYGKGPCKPFSEGIRIKVTSVEADSGMPEDEPATESPVHRSNAEEADAVGLHYRHPDASVFCEPRRHWQGDERLFTNPTFLFEVTSVSTKDVDHGVKVREYLVLESLEAYAVVSHVTPEITVYRRGPSGVVLETFTAGRVPLGHGLELDVDALYR